MPRARQCFVTNKRPTPAEQVDARSGGYEEDGASAGTLAERRTLIDTFAGRYARADKSEKTRILDEVCAVTGWHRSHARKVLLIAARPKPARPLRGGQAKYDAKVVDALTVCWEILGMPAGKRLAPMLPELVAALRRHRELRIDDETADLLTGMSAATIDRRLAPQRQRPRQAAAARIRPGSLLRNELPLRTWAEWDHSRPGFVEITVIRHDAGTGSGDYLRTVSVTDIATGWTENRTLPARTPVSVGLDEIAATYPFPILGLDSGNHGAETDEVLLRWCEHRKVTFTHSRPACGGNHHVGQKNWSMLHAIVGEYGYYGTAELLLLNMIWAALSRLTNFFYPQQQLVSISEHNGRRRKEFDTATPYRRTERHARVTPHDKAILADTYAGLNPAGLHRRLRTMTELLNMITTRRMARANTPLVVRVVVPHTSHAMSGAR